MSGIRQHGFTMIEVMVAIAIFGVGLIGMAALSTTNLQNAAVGHLESQATIIAAQLADGMRSNLQAYESGLFAASLEPGEKSCFGNAQCNYDEAAHYDSDMWLLDTAAALPGGIAVICMDSTPADGSPDNPACDGLGLNTIKVFWAASQELEGDAGADTFSRHVLSLVP